MAYTHDIRDITANAMTAASSGGYVASASSENGSYPAWMAFDHKCHFNTQMDNWLGHQTALPNSWLKIDLGAAVCANSYKITGWFTTAFNYGYAHPKNWKFQGSNNDSTWTDLDSQSDAPAWSEIETREYSFTNTTAYRYYRLLISATQGSGVYICVGELELLEAIVPNGLQTIPHITTMYRNNPVELLNLVNRQRVGIVGTTKHNYIGA